MLNISDGLSLSPLTQDDAPYIVEHMKDKSIYLNTIAIPYPYTKEVAEQFIKKNGNQKDHLAIRTDRLVGIISAESSERQPHSAMLGYWLAKPYWGKGIMTGAVKTFSNFLMTEYKMVRLVANCFEHNIGSARVLEKSGFNFEGLMIKHYLKDDGAFYNGKRYAKVQ